MATFEYWEETRVPPWDGWRVRDYGDDDDDVCTYLCQFIQTWL